MSKNKTDLPCADFEKYDNAIGLIAEKWKDRESVASLARQMEILGRNMASLRGSQDAENRKKARIVWQKAAQQYWELVWAIVEAKIDAGPPEELEFGPEERLFIDFGHLYSRYTTQNPAFAKQFFEPSALDMYQYNRLTDYLKENYALIFGKPFKGPTGGVTLEEKLARFEKELKVTETRRRMAMHTLFSDGALIKRDELDAMLQNLENGIRDAVESDMRTRRVREAEGSEKRAIQKNYKDYVASERQFWSLMDELEHRIAAADEEPEEEFPEPEVLAPEEAAQDEEGDFDPFVEIGREAGANEDLSGHVSAGFAEESAALPDHRDDSGEDGKEKTSSARPDKTEQLDQSLKIVQNVIGLHDKSKFLESLIVHIRNEAERWKTRCENAKAKFKGQGIPALKLEMRENLNHKKEFMLLAARSARVDASPLCQSKNLPLSARRAGEIMMDLTPTDPEMLRASRIRMYGIPRVILVPGQGLGVYDWEDNSIVIPIFPVASDEKSFGFALASFRWDNDEDRTLKDTYALLKANKGKGIRALQEAFCNDYFLWVSKERRGYRVLPKETAKWFKAFFKQKVGGFLDGKK